MKKITFLKTSLLAAAVSLLAACGGGDGGSGAGGATGSAVGTLTDSPVAGVSYRTSSGITGLTDASGHFRYNPGDTVTFKIGELTLGAVTASGSNATITPLQIAQAAGGSDAVQANRVSNLLVLLQSLDSDGDASNGITIPAAAGTALNTATAGTLSLVADPAVFAASIGGVVSSAGGELVDSEDALAHFKQQFFKDLAGVHFFSDSASGEVIAFRVNADGSYLMGEVAEADDAGQPGIESGQIDWNPSTGEITADVFQDTNGEWGLSHIVNERLFFSLQGGNLHIVVKPEGDAQEELVFSRINAGTGAAGTWVLDREEASNSNALGREQFIFYRVGNIDYYLMLDPVGGDGGCGNAGLELGRYSLSGGVFTASGIVEDSNGCAGLHDDGDYSQFTNVVVASETISLQEGEDTFTLRRITTTPELVFMANATVSNSPAVGEVHEPGLNVFCGHEYENGESFFIKIDLDAAAGTFRLSWVGGDADDYFDGSYNAETGVLSHEASDGPDAIEGHEGFLHKSEISFSGSYDAAQRKVSGSWEESLSTIWTGRSPNPTATCTSVVSFTTDVP